MFRNRKLEKNSKNNYEIGNRPINDLSPYFIFIPYLKWLKARWQPDSAAR